MSGSNWLPAHPADRLDPAPRQDLETKRLFGESLWYAVHVELMTLDRAWHTVHPTSQASEQGAKRLARRWLRWFQERFPRRIEEMVTAHERAGLASYEEQRMHTQARGFDGVAKGAKVLSSIYGKEQMARIWRSRLLG